MSDEESQKAWLPSWCGPIGDVASGITLPARVANSLWKAAARIISAGAEVPEAWLQGKAQAIRRTTSARDIVTQGAAEAAAKQFDDPELARRALERYGSDIVRQQANLESIFRKATEEIASDPPQQDSSDEIDDDWLSRFYGEASKTSNEDMQRYLSKILAGEIKKPGTFSIRSILTLCMISEYTATSFERLCNMSIDFNGYMTILIWEPIGNPGHNGMAECDMPYVIFDDLIQNELIVSELSMGIDLSDSIERKIPFDLAGTKICLSKKQDGKITNMTNVKNVKLTNVGQQLRSILSLQPDDRYKKRLRSWFNRNGVDLLLVRREQGGQWYGTPM